MKNEKVVELIDFCIKMVKDAIENKEVGKIEESIKEEYYNEGAEHTATKFIMKLNELLKDDE